MSDPKMSQALLELGEEFGWSVDLIERGGRTLIVRDGESVAIGEILTTGDRVMFDTPLPLEQVS